MKTRHIIDQTKQLISIPSTADNVEALHEAIDFVAAIVSTCPGVTIERFEQNGVSSFLAYRGQVRPAKFDILLNGHVDVVPAKPEQFKAIEKDGRLYGRGALDMKGTTLVLTDAFCKLVNTVPYALGLQIVSDEEIGGYDGVRLQIDNGVRAEFVIMGEYANDRNTIYNAARGLCWAEISFKGKTAHGGHLWHGSNAVVKAGEFAAAVLRRYPTPDKETWTTTASIANLSTPNQVFNKVPDSAILKIDFRFTQEDPVFENEASLKAFIASIDPDAELNSTATFEPAVKVEQLNPYVQGLSRALKRTTGQETRYLGRPASSDGRHFAIINNDIVEFGLYGQNPHGDEEYVEMSSFDEYHEILCAFLTKPIPEQLTRSSYNSEPLHLQLLRRLVAMPTVTSDHASVGAALAYIEHYLKDRGMFIERFECNGIQSIVATTKKDERKPKVLLNAHIDVVPAAKDKFQLTIEDDKIQGRGVMDMKLAIASYMALVDKLQDNLADYDFGVMITSDEEIGGRNGVKMLIEEEGYQPRVAVVPDGGENWQLEAFCKGVQWVRLTANGKSAHASRPWEGESAINHLLSALQEIKALTPTKPSPEDTFISVGTIEGGTTPNQIPVAASAMLDIRSGNVKDHDLVYGQVVSICKKYDIEVDRVVNDPPTVNDPGNPYIEPFVGLVTKLTGKQHGTSYSYGVTDGRFFSALNIPCIIIEPAAGDRHKESEWLSKEGFDTFNQVLEEYIQLVALRTTSKPHILNKSYRDAEVTKPAKKAYEYIWYANYGGGLSYENFLRSLCGGIPDGGSYYYAGCRDKTPPQENHFTSLPYELYFSGESLVWPGGGLGTLSVEHNPKAQTIARIYLIRIEQFEEMVAQENQQTVAKHLPLARVIKNGHALTGYANGLYNELLFCGMRDNYPMFAITANRLNQPYTAPSKGYTQSVLRGLSENSRIDTTMAKAYIRDQHRTISELQRAPRPTKHRISSL